MNIRKLFDWRKLLIYTHRWMGIVFGLVFIVWFISGIAFMYVGMPSLSLRERLGHIPPLDLSTARLSPAEAAERNGIEPGRFTVEMHYDGRPVYRFGSTKVYADTGDTVGGMNAIAAANLIRRWVPEHASTVQYDAYLEDSDQWTLQNAQRQYMPLHRISLGDPAGTVYYVSEGTGEPVMKTDRRARFWGFTSGVLHWTYFTALRRHSYFWNKLVAWGSIVGAFMCLTGIVAGIWRLGIRRRYRIKGALSHSPYAGWMWWHHYAGLIFGFLTLTWAFSGALSLTPFQSLRGTPVTQQQRRALSGGRLDVNSISVDRLKAALAEFTPSFTRRRRGGRHAASGASSERETPRLRKAGRLRRRRCRGGWLTS